MGSQPLDTTWRVVTPENIAFEYRLAGPFRRLPALLIDLAILTALQIALAIAVMTTAGQLSEGLASFLLLVSIFLCQWTYGIGFEAFANGQTPGKYLTGLRVLSMDGRPVDGLQATLRNVLRAADLWLPLVGLVTMALNPRFQRLGDLVAGTIVVVEERTMEAEVLAVEDPRAVQLAACIPPGFLVHRPLAQCLANYVERRKHFGPARRREIARHLAEPLLERFGLPRDTSYDLLLCALYYRTFISEPLGEGAVPSPASAAAARTAAVPAPAGPPA